MYLHLNNVVRGKIFTAQGSLIDHRTNTYMSNFRPLVALVKAFELLVGSCKHLIRSLVIFLVCLFNFISSHQRMFIIM